VDHAITEDGGGIGLDLFVVWQAAENLQVGILHHMPAQEKGLLSTVICLL
jgi:hypothetical protein